MRVLTLSIALTAVAHAQFAEKMAGPYVDVAGGLALSDAPIAAGPGWMGGLGWWFGRYDESYAIGRYTSIGANVRQEWVQLARDQGATVRTAPPKHHSKSTKIVDFWKLFGRSFEGNLSIFGPIFLIF